ncbi:MAG: hypothetical protein ABR561_01160 [Guyparkeria sp.]
MLDYFLSSDWAIIATELLAGFIVISLVLAVLVWRGQRRHTGAAERLLDDRDPIVRASEEMFDRQVQRVWPELELDDEQRETYAERSLDAVEAMVEPWLEPKRYELAAVARRFLQVRQADLEQLLTIARTQAEQEDGDDPRISELETSVEELREQRDRQGKQLADSLETINVMVREYGRKFDYTQEPHVATVLKAIVLIDEMEAGADCETAKRRADEVFSEDLIATPAAAGDNSASEEAPQDTQEERPAAEPASNLSPEEEMAAAMAEQTGADSSQADHTASEAPEQAPSEPRPETEPTDDGEPESTREDDTVSSTTPDPTPDATKRAEGVTDPAEASSEGAADVPDEKTASAPAPDDEESAPADTDDIDQLIDSAAKAHEATSDITDKVANEVTNKAAEVAGKAEQPDETTSNGDQPNNTNQADADETETRSDDGDRADAEKEDRAAGGEPASSQPAEEGPPLEPADEAPAQEEAEQAQDSQKRREDQPDDADNGVIDLDDVEIPEGKSKDQSDDKDQEFDLDDIDALLDAEIARKHGKDD